MRGLLLIPFLLAACGSDPLEEDLAAYHAALQPPLAKNMELARAFLDVASRVKKQETNGPAVAEQLARELVPVADELKAAAVAVEPRTPQLADTHALLVKAWGDRASAYHAMADAWAKGDLAAFDAAMDRNVRSKLEEERYFNQVNALARPYGVVIDQYP